MLKKYLLVIFLFFISNSSYGLSMTDNCKEKYGAESVYVQGSNTHVEWHSSGEGFWYYAKCTYTRSNGEVRTSDPQLFWFWAYEGELGAEYSPAVNEAFGYPDCETDPNNADCHECDDTLDQQVYSGLTTGDRVFDSEYTYCFNGCSVDVSQPINMAASGETGETVYSLNFTSNGNICNDSDVDVSAGTGSSIPDSGDSGSDSGGDSGGSSGGDSGGSSGGDSGGDSGGSGGDGDSSTTTTTDGDDDDTSTTTDGDNSDIVNAIENVSMTIVNRLDENTGDIVSSIEDMTRDIKLQSYKDRDSINSKIGLLNQNTSNQGTATRESIADVKSSIDQLNDNLTSTDGECTTAECWENQLGTGSNELGSINNPAGFNISDYLNFDASGWGMTGACPADMEYTVFGQPFVVRMDYLCTIFQFVGLLNILLGYVFAVYAFVRTGF